MKVELISFTRPAGKLENSDIKDAKDLVVYCARISNPTNQMNTKTSRKLVDYLKKHKHWSPFEMVDVCLEIETTRDIARQMLRHRSFCFQEFSQRYSDVSALGDLFEISEARMQDPQNRQNSIEADSDDVMLEWEKLQNAVMSTTSFAYRTALDMGIAKEVARKVLPEGLTKTRLFMKGSIRSWIHYLEIRGPGSGTQKEHVMIAEQIAHVVNQVFSFDNKVE